MTEVALQFQDVSYQYPGSNLWALHNANLSIERNAFTVITGPTGCGKSTLLKLARGIYRELGGSFQGKIRVAGVDVSEHGSSGLTSRVAIVFQNPSYQLHQLRVIDEIMSAPMYQGLPWAECLERAAHSIDGIVENNLLAQNPTRLSTGQQQRVALAASLAMMADILLLDEPFSYLDENATDNFLRIIKRLQSGGKTILISTHSLELVAKFADAILLMDKGRVIEEGSPRGVLYSTKLADTLGSPLHIKAGILVSNFDQRGRLPLCWDDIYRVLANIRLKVPTPKADVNSLKSRRAAAIELANVSFQYNSDRAVLTDVSMNIRKGEILGIVGRNGSGKTTLVKLILGILKSTTGDIRIFGRHDMTQSEISSHIGYVSQNPSDMLFETTVLRECSFGPILQGLSEPVQRAIRTLKQMKLLQYATRDPRSLSGGQQRLLTIANVLVSNPSIIVFDEPEFGLDSRTYNDVVCTIRKLKEQGKTVIIVTHRLESTALLCDRVALLYDGRISALVSTHQLISDGRILRKAHLRYIPFFAVLSAVFGHTLSSINEDTFLDSLKSALDDSAIIS